MNQNIFLVEIKKMYILYMPIYTKTTGFKFGKMLFFIDLQ